MCYDKTCTVEVRFAKSKPTEKTTRVVVGGKGRVPKVDAGARLRWFGGIRSVELSLMRRAITLVTLRDFLGVFVFSKADRASAFLYETTIEKGKEYKSWKRKLFLRARQPHLSPP